jgi:RNA polymerase sigma-70 factor, ECF subfamily
VRALIASEIERVFREEYGRAVAVLVRVFGDIDVAEEAVQDAFTTAVQRWPSAGLPPSPQGWIITTARNRAIDRLRREASREDRHAQAIRLGRLLGELMPDEAEVRGLLALMLLVESRMATRTTPDGDIVLLADQDRGLWNRGLIAEGQAIVRQCLRRNQPGPYQVQAAINAVHSDAPTAAATEWRQILQLYDQLLSLAPSPVVALNRAVAVAEVEGPDAALTLVDGLDLDGYHVFHAIRADLLRRLGRDAEAALAYEAAIARTENAAERDFLRRNRQGLTRA